MSLIRLLLTTAAMGAIAVALDRLGPDVGEISTVLRSAQQTADSAGPDAVVVAVAALLAWLIWAWGALGLALTATGALPGALGGAARLAGCVALPGGTCRVAALALGLGLGFGAPSVLAGTPSSALHPVASSAPVPDWPPAPSHDSSEDPVPDWPGRADASEHVVVRGDCLWDIATRRLESAAGHRPSNAAIASAVQGWWSVNAVVIGPDPDLIFPGQVLRPPAQR